MRLVRNVRLAGLVLMTTAAFFLAVQPAWAATSVTDLTGPDGITIGASVERAIFGVNISGGGTWNTLDVDFAQVGDADFEPGDLAGIPDGVAVYRDDGTTDDVFDSGDTRGSSGYAFTGLSAEVDVAEPIPDSATGFNFFVTIKTSPSISPGDDFTMSIPGGLLNCGFHTSPAQLVTCGGGSSQTITADTSVPTATLTSTPATVDGNVVWTFNEDVDGTVSDENAVLREVGSSDDIPSNVTYNTGTKTATLDPTNPLTPGTSYVTFVNPTGATDPVTDEAGNPVEENTQGSFSLSGVGFTPGVVRGNTWLLSNGPNRVVDTDFQFGKATDYPIAGDWDGDGQWQAGVVRGNVWYLANETPPASITSFVFGKATDFPIAGDWDNDGDDEPGVVRGNVWYLSNNSPPTAITKIFAFGKATDFPIAGDWDGDGDDQPGLVRGNVWYLSNNPQPTSIGHTFAFGKATDYPIAGNWDGDGGWTVGVVRGNSWFLANEVVPQTVTSFTFGSRFDFPIVGDWDGPSAESEGSGLLQQVVPGN